MKVSFRALHLLAESHHANCEGSRIKHQVLVVLQCSPHKPLQGTASSLRSAVDALDLHTKNAHREQTLRPQ